MLLAPGHPGLNVPDELRDDPRAVHAYEPHEYARTVTIVGAGLAAATEWLNALAAGSEVVSVRRREPVRRPLNVPRPYFSRRGLSTFHRLGADERSAVLRSLLAPSYPPGRAFDEPLARAAAEGRFRVEPSVNGTEQVVCATGFRRGFEHDPLLAGLVGREAARDGCGLDRARPRFNGARPYRPHANARRRRGCRRNGRFPEPTRIVGAKVAARAFLRRIRACPTR